MRALRAHHITLKVHDLDQAIAFLTEVLGFEEIVRTDLPGARGWSIPGDRFQIHLSDEGASDTGADAINPHLALAVENLDATRAALTARAIAFVDFGLLLFVRDPSGNVFELREDVT